MANCIQNRYFPFGIQLIHITINFAVDANSIVGRMGSWNLLKATDLQSAQIICLTVRNSGKLGGALYWFTGTTVFQVVLTDIIVWHYFGDLLLPILFYEFITLSLVARQLYSYHLLRDNNGMIRSSLMQLVIQETMVYLLLWVFRLNSSQHAVFDNSNALSLAGAFTPITMVMLSIVGNRILFGLRRAFVGDSSSAAWNYHMSTLNLRMPESTIATGSDQSSGERNGRGARI
ncbi:hypothetical protein L218DRAFT_949166 [Marasmius fiardii PR-910]|nr:hypothetical protein L218DRAFT_949166 [Marasmius fiardii PR-910]